MRQIPICLHLLFVFLVLSGCQSSQFRNSSSYEKSSKPVVKSSKPDETLIRTSIDDLTGKKTQTVVFDSENTVANSIGDPEYPSLVIRCSSDDTDLYLTTPTYNADNQIVYLRWGNKGVEEDYWQPSERGTALFSRIPGLILEKLIEHDTVVLGWQPYGTVRKTARFDLKTVRRDLKQMSKYCGTNF